MSAVFDKFWALLVEGLELNADAKLFIRSAWDQTAGIALASHTSTSSPTSGSSGGKGSGRITGYNLYMREKSAEIKANKEVIPNRLSYIGSQWKALPQAKRDEFNARARGDIITSAPTNVQQPVAAPPQTTPPVVKQLNGYQFYVKHIMPVLVKDGIPSGERMKHISTLWHKLSPEEQKRWKDGALTNTPPAQEPENLDELEEPEDPEEPEESEEPVEPVEINKSS